MLLQLQTSCALNWSPRRYLLDGILGENALNQVVTIVVLLLVKCDFGQPISRWDVIRSLLRDRIEHLFCGFQIARLNLEVGIAETVEEAPGRQVSARRVRGSNSVWPYANSRRHKLRSAKR